MANFTTRRSFLAALGSAVAAVTFGVFGQKATATGTSAVAVSAPAEPNPTFPAVRDTFAYVVYDHPPSDAWAVIKCVNDSPLCGMAAGTVLVDGMESLASQGCNHTVITLRHRPSDWNVYYLARTGQTLSAPMYPLRNLNDLVAQGRFGGRADGGPLTFDECMAMAAHEPA